MARFTLRLSLLWVLLFTLLGVTMSALGSTQPIHPALRGFVEGCEGVPQPCWYGIVPGVTTPNEAEMTLLLHGFASIQRDEYQFWVNADWGEVNLVVDRNYGVRLSGVYLRPFTSVTLADGLSVFPSMPTHVGRTCNDDYSLLMGQISISTSGTTPVSEVYRFNLGSIMLGGRIMIPQNRWRGFWADYHETGGAGCG